jgi:hypothetical protein
MSVLQIKKYAHFGVLFLAQVIGDAVQSRFHHFYGHHLREQMQSGVSASLACSMYLIIWKAQSRVDVVFWVRAYLF